MYVRLLGVRSMDFDSQGEHIKGTQLFFAFKADGVDGEMSDKVFLRDGFKVPPLKPGTMLNLGFNNRGKIESVEIAQ